MSILSQEHVLLVDDHPLFRAALSEALNRVSMTLILNHADSLAQARETLNAKPISLICLDLHLGDAHGFVGLNTLRQEYPSIPVVVVSAREERGIAHKALEFGASGFIPKTLTLDTMIAAFQAIFAGEEWVPESGLVVEDDKTVDDAAKLATLTPAQMRVLHGLVSGQLNKQIAYDMDITVATVKAHVTAIFKKLGVINRTQAVLMASTLFDESDT